MRDFRKFNRRSFLGRVLGGAVVAGGALAGLSGQGAAHPISDNDPTDEGGRTVVALVSSTIFGDGSALYYLFQACTALILFLAANTSFNAFPRLAALLAIDGYLPRQFALRGDRLAFSYGIVILAAVAAGLLIFFGGDTHALIPLYSVGVFVCFTLSQVGMVRHWHRHRERGWWYRAAINGIGAVLTAVVLAVVTSVKFVDGAWFVVVLIPVLVSMMLFIRREYDGQERELHVREDLVVEGPHREQRAQLLGEQVRAPQTGAHAAKAQRRIVFRRKR